MKTKLLFSALIASIFAFQMQAQNRTTVYAKSNDISDNLDLKAVASIFGDSDNLQDFERRLNDPKLQISNLDLNNDDQVDYLRVIESVEKRTHVIIIQSVLDRDVYQDIATIDVEKDNYNAVHIQVVGNTYMYGENYIYEPVYYRTPVIYASFWSIHYRPYASTWYWNYYPSYYYAWSPYPVFRYRNNIYNCVNNYNSYNYVTYRSSRRAENIYNSRRNNGYEIAHPDYSFSRRNSEISNRYELDRNRNTRNVGSRNERNSTGNSGYTTRENTPQRDYSKNRANGTRENTPQRTEPQRDYSQNRANGTRENTPQRTESQRDYSQNRANGTRENTPQRTEPQRDYSQNRANTTRENTPQRTEPQRDYSQNRANTTRENTPQRTEPQRDYSQNRTNVTRENAPQRSEPQRNNNSGSRDGNRRT
ncbi:hypothetical protein [Flavobacterium restrictum]|uniref:DUF3300 domain-containing protein n=1 Tax=Flavobacterium restrictum TaxID=2594428 RepID=A0A553DXU6_9FLAO|nr:hypothetical protein [Flavobacterium restrictum]TRX37520.1 hypothetical protein FNW21_12105 [Flavobacterium restrictum]